jgi:putative ATP-binding cassette transporter
MAQVQAQAQARNHHLALTRSLRALRLFFASDVGRQAIGWSLLLLCLLLSINGLNVVNSYVGRDFMTAIAKRHPGLYYRYALYYLGVFALSTVVTVFNRFSEERLRLLWRGWLTRILINGYLSGHTYYRIQARQEIDNPDQRITDDVKSYTQTTLSFFILSLNSVITSAAFLGVLWSITPLLVVVAVAYAAAGTTATILLGRRLIRLNNLQLRKEADLRYHLIQVREAAETIATVGIERAMRARLRGKLDEVVSNLRAIIGVNRNLGFLTNGYNYLIQIVPLLIVAPLYIRGKVEFGVVTQSAMAFSTVLGAFSLIVTQFDTLSTFAAVTERLNTIADAIEQSRAPSATAIELVQDDDRIAYEGLTLRSPRQQTPLLIELSLSLLRGRTLLIVGPNGPAKDALFVATAGIWEEGEGRIIRPHRDQIEFVPRRPLAISGTLRERLLIATPERTFDEAALLQVLHAVGLDAVVDRVGGLDAEHDWAASFSLGEQHLIALARVLLLKPRFAFLDRVAEALADDQVEHLYHVLSEAGITYLSIGESDRLASYHHALLELEDDGRWHLAASPDGSHPSTPFPTATVAQGVPPSARRNQA